MRRTKSPSWAQAVDRFVADLVDRERSLLTRANYREDLQAFAGWYEHRFQDPPTLALLAPSELREWKAHLRDERKMEPATVNRKLAALRSLLRWAESAGLAPEIAPPSRSARSSRRLDGSTAASSAPCSAPSSGPDAPATSGWSSSSCTPASAAKRPSTSGGMTSGSASGRVP
jgi:hypothetical protein